MEFDAQREMDEAKIFAFKMIVCSGCAVICIVPVMVLLLSFFCIVQGKEAKFDMQAIIGVTLAGLTSLGIFSMRQKLITSKTKQLKKGDDDDIRSISCRD